MSAPSARPLTKWPIAAAFGLVASLAVALIMLAFLWPSKTATPQNIPISVAGPPAAVTAFTDAAQTYAPGTFEFVAADGRDDAVEQIRVRSSYGAVILAEPPQAPEVLTAPAGSSTVAQMLSGIAEQLQAQTQQQIVAAGGDPSQVSVQLTEVVPFADEDPAGAGILAASFPLVIGGLAGGILIALLVTGPLRRLIALAGFGAVTGIAAALVLHSWFEILPSGFWVNALAIGLSALATASFVVGCVNLLGNPGIGVAAVFTMLIANPLSAANTPWQFLAEPWGAFGQWLVPGASSTLVRTINYFPDTDASRQWWVLTGWIFLGLVLSIAGYLRSRTATMPRDAAAMP